MNVVVVKSLEIIVEYSTKSSMLFARRSINFLYNFIFTNIKFKNMGMCHEDGFEMIEFDYENGYMNNFYIDLLYDYKKKVDASNKNINLMIREKYSVRKDADNVKECKDDVSQ